MAKHVLPASEQLLSLSSSQLRNYVASAQQGSHNDAAKALAQGNTHNPAQPLSQASTAFLYPDQITSSLLPARGMLGLLLVPTQVQAVQVKVVSRLLEPEQLLAWKGFETHHLGLAPQLQYLTCGASVLFSTVPAIASTTYWVRDSLQTHRLLPVWSSQVACRVHAQRMCPCSSPATCKMVMGPIV